MFLWLTKCRRRFSVKLVMIESSALKCVSQKLFNISKTIKIKSQLKKCHQSNWVHSFIQSVESISCENFIHYHELRNGIDQTDRYLHEQRIVNLCARILIVYHSTAFVHPESIDSDTHNKSVPVILVNASNREGKRNNNKR